MELNGGFDLTPLLKELHLGGMGVTLGARQREAENGQWSYQEFLARLLQDEVERRAQNQLAARLKKAAVNTTKSLESFDWHFNPTINRQQVLRLASGEYLRQHSNVLIVGPTGAGKSHLAQGLAHEACRQGHRVLFINTHKMLQHLAGGRADHSLNRRMALYTRPDLLVLDDFGLKPLQPPGPEDLYDIIVSRYEVGSIVLTTNRAPSEWPELFQDPLLGSAGLDRLAHHAESLVITGPSYRKSGAGSGSEAREKESAREKENLKQREREKGVLPS